MQRTHALFLVAALLLSFATAAAAHSWEDWSKVVHLIGPSPGPGQARRPLSGSLTGCRATRPSVMR